MLLVRQESSAGSVAAKHAQPGALDRLLLGWVTGEEKTQLSLSDFNTANSASSPTTQTYVLWPYDRGESRDRCGGCRPRV
jgi:hypothetical protein